MSKVQQKEYVTIQLRGWMEFEVVVTREMVGKTTQLLAGERQQ